MSTISRLSVVLALASDASARLGAGTSRIEESASSLFAAGIASTFATCGAAHAKQNGRDRQARNCSPHKAKCFSAESGVFTVAIEMVAALDIAGASCGFLVRFLSRTKYERLIWNTHVMRAVVITWKTHASQVRRLER